MCKKKKKIYVKMKKLEAQIWTCTRQGLKFMPWFGGGGGGGGTVKILI